MYELFECEDMRSAATNPDSTYDIPVTRQHAAPYKNVASVAHPPRVVYRFLNSERDGVCVRIVTWFRKRDSYEHPQGEHSRFPDFKFTPSFEASGRTRRVVLYQEIKKSGRDGSLVE